MKIIKPALLLAIVVAVIVFITANTPPMEKDYDEQWKKVDSLVNLRQPRSALEVVDEIYQLSKSENNTPQLIKAHLYRIRLMSEFEEDNLVKAVSHIQDEISTAAFPEKQLLHSILGDLYMRYFQMNSYQILERGRLLNFEGDDIRTWDAHKLLSTAGEHFQASLEPAADLQKIELESYTAILDEKKDSKLYRPTLYDFLAHRAIGFYATGQSDITVAADQFKPDNAQYFGPAAEFIKFEIPEGKSHTHTAKALMIFQSLLEFHLDAETTPAIIDADLKRLEFVHSNAIVENPDSLYQQALNRLHNQHGNSPFSADIAFELAKFHNMLAGKYNPHAGEDYRWKRKKAVEICEAAINKFPGSDGAENCRVLMNQMTRSSLSIKTEQAVLPAKPSLGLLEWKNYNKVYYRLIEMDIREFNNLTWRTGTADIARELIRKTAKQNWQLDVLNENDFQNHTAEFKIPELTEGFYVLLASGSADFTGGEKEITWVGFWVTNITFISQRLEEGGHEIYVLDREKGTPLKNVTVRAFTRDYDNRSREYSENFFEGYTTDANGYFQIKPAASGKNISVMLEFIHNDDSYYPDTRFHLSNPRTREPRPELKTFFFTDRAIYRPGQTVYFKAIVLEKAGDRQEIKTEHSTTVEFYDVNHQKISSLDLVTSEFGAVDGSFTIPSGVLNGQMTIRNKSGSAGIRVEEYKRPTFEVTFEPVKGSYKLGEDVTIDGEAAGYAGNMMDNATVKYRVVRRSSFPFRWHYHPGIIPQTSELEILAGETTTDENGNFTVTFNAIPDHSLSRELRPVFRYTVYASVTDISGETQAGEQTVSVGYDALQLNIDIPEKLDRTKQQAFDLDAVNYNGEKQETTVSVEIHKLKQPDGLLINRLWSRPDMFVMDEDSFKNNFPGRVYDDEQNPANWEKEQEVFTRIFDTKTDTLLSPDNLQNWNPGKYAITLKAVDVFGNDVETTRYFTVYSPNDRYPPLETYNWFTPVKDSGEPGEEAAFLVGTSARSAYALYEVQHRGKTVHREWLRLGRKQELIKVPIKEEYRGNFSVQVNFVIDGREYKNSLIIKVPYTNKQLDLAFETFRSQLEPGSSEEWKITIKSKMGDQLAAQMLASMYDASLDAFVRHGWSFDLYHSQNQTTPWQSHSNFSIARGSRWNFGTDEYKPFINQEYDRLNWFGLGSFDHAYFSIGTDMKARTSIQSAAGESMEMEAGDVNEMIPLSNGENEGRIPPPPAEDPDIPAGLEDLQVRRDFNETAFFYPDLQTNEQGEVVIRFTLPESFTRWKFMGLAHTKDLMTGMLEEEFTASKKLMVMPNAPRFFRMSDTLWFSARISNLSQENLEGSAMLELFDAVTMQPVSADLQLSDATRGFTVEAARSTSVRWRIIIPETYGVIAYRVKATAGNYSDGEEKPIPVLPNRMLVTETMPMPVRGEETKTFRLERLIDAEKSTTLKHQNLTLEFTSNPAWYAVQALPVISEPQHKNALSVFAAYYANSIAINIVNTNPKIKRVFDAWKTQTPDTFLSNLEKNQELKMLLLEQTPWVLQAKDEAERKQRIALLFDLNNMQHRMDGAIRMLQQMQSSGGGFPWFEGMRDNRYITQQIVLGFGKLHRMGIIDAQNDDRVSRMLNQAIRYLEERIREDYEEIRKARKDNIEEDNLSALHIQFLYARSFYDFIKLNPNSETAFNYFKNQSEKYWQKNTNYLQGMIAVALHRYGNDEVPALITRSLKERSLISDEMGMYWKTDRGFYWYQSPVETQAMMIEVFDEVANDSDAVELMKIWLLKKKQTQDWKTSRATVEAVNALLTRGSNLLESDELVEIEIAGEPLVIENLAAVEAGTGYIQTSWGAGEIKPEMGNVTVTKPDEGIAWGAVYWQYFEDLDKITPHESPLSLKKQLFVERNSPSGVVIKAVNEGDVLNIGDKLIVRIELRADRNMEYVHMKDMRASAFEPVNVLSGFKYKGGLGYYESTGDAATNFFFDHLHKGTYVFEYPLVVSQTGNFSNGISTIQCMYAPEFSSHSQGIRVNVE